MARDRFVHGTMSLISRGWVPTVLLLVAAGTIGPALGAITRPVFVAGCVLAGWHAWRIGPQAHIQSAIALFTFAPFVRRLVDVAAGFDQAGIMLIGPLLFVLVPALSLLTPPAKDQPRNPWVLPSIIVLGCVGYGAALSLFQNDWFNAASGALKWSAPVLYAMALQQEADDSGDLVHAAARAFLVILPITGLYGVWQYVDPQLWDQYWMNFASITSAGLPKPYLIRVFSTMNGPASYATFTATGLLLVCFLRPGWQSLLAMAPAALGLLLSLYRTAWIALAVGLVFCAMFASTRRRAIGTGLGIAGAAVATVALLPFGQVIADRLESLSSGSEDSSGSERLEEFVTLWNMPDSMVFGAGFSNVDVGTAGAMPVDGQIIACWITMGIPVGLLCLAAYMWTGFWATSAAWRNPTREGVVLGALAFSAVVIQMPLTSIASGEVSALFWMLAAMACPRETLPAGVPQPAELPLKQA